LFHRGGCQSGNLTIAIAQAAANERQGIAMAPCQACGHGLLPLKAAHLEMALQFCQQRPSAPQVGRGGQRPYAIARACAAGRFLVHGVQHQFHLAAVQSGNGRGIGGTQDLGAWASH